MEQPEWIVKKSGGIRVDKINHAEALRRREYNNFAIGVGVAVGVENN